MSTEQTKDAADYFDSNILLNIYRRNNLINGNRILVGNYFYDYSLDRIIKIKEEIKNGR